MGQLVGVPTKTQNYTRATLQSAQTPTGNKRIIEGGMSSRGVILNDPSLEQCVVGGVKIDYQLVRKIALGGAKGDVPVTFNFPVTQIWIASKDGGHLVDSLFFHFSKMGKTYTGNAVTLDGSEQMFDMTYTPANGNSFFGKMLRFRVPFTSGYFEIGQDAGGTDYNILVAGADGDIVEMFANNSGTTV